MYYVYRFFNHKNKVIYVGRTKNLDDRMKSHFVYNGHLGQDAYDEVSKIEYSIMPTYLDMKIKELYYINMFHPKYNVKDNQEEQISFSINCSSDIWFEYVLLDLDKEYAKTQENALLNQYLKTLVGKKLNKDEQVELINRINHKVNGHQQKSYSKLNIALQILKLPYVITSKQERVGEEKQTLWTIEKYKH